MSQKKQRAGAPRAAAGGAPLSMRARFAEACAKGGVPEEDRDALWRLVDGETLARRSDERMASVLADYGHWRLYLAGRTGDERAAASFRRYWMAAAKAYLAPRTPRAAVEELGSAFLERVWQKVGVRFRWGCSFRAYLKSILVNLGRDQGALALRRRQREVSLDGSDRDDDGDERRPLAERLAFGAQSAEHRMMERERDAAVRDALQSLSPADRHVLLSCVVDEADGDDVATALGIERDAVYQRLHRAKTRLAKVLAERGIAS